MLRSYMSFYTEQLIMNLCSKTAVEIRQVALYSQGKDKGRTEPDSAEFHHSIKEAVDGRRITQAAELRPFGGFVIRFGTV